MEGYSLEESESTEAAIDTYSYIDVVGSYKIGDETKRISGSYQLFDKFVVWGEW